MHCRKDYHCQDRSRYDVSRFRAFCNDLFWFIKCATDIIAAPILTVPMDCGCHHYLWVIMVKRIDNFRPFLKCLQIDFFCIFDQFSWFPNFRKLQHATHLKNYQYWPNIINFFFKLFWCSIMYKIYVICFFIDELRKFTISDFPKQTHFGHILINLFIFFTLF